MGTCRQRKRWLTKLCKLFAVLIDTQKSHSQSSKAGTTTQSMGSPVSAIVANIYMEHFEELALQTASERLRVRKRYVDDTCCIIRKEAVDGFLKHLNNIRDSIRFTMEEEKDNSLPFLDTLLMRRDNGTIDIKVYRKPTHTDRYLDFRSHHPSFPHQKRSGKVFTTHHPSFPHQKRSGKVFTTQNRLHYI